MRIKKMKLRNKLSLVLLAALLCSFFSLTVCAADHSELDVDIPSSRAKAVYLYSYEGDRVLMLNGENKKLPPVSTAKMMAGLLACEKYADRLDERVTVSSKMLEGVSGNAMGLRSGTEITVRELLYGVACGCNNDAAIVLAYACAGSVEAFVEEMNGYAKRLDMRSTRYTDTTGFDTNAFTSITDVAKLARAAVDNKLYLEISSTQSYELVLNGTATTVYNRNALISQFSTQGYLNKYASGLIAGSTEEAGYVLATFAQKNDKSFLCIVMGASANSDEIYSYKIVNDLLNTAFSDYSVKKIASADDIMTKAQVSLALTDKNGAFVSCRLAEDVSALLPYGVDVADVRAEVYLHDEEICAPVTKGEIVGGVDFYYNDVYLASGRLIAGEDVEPSALLLMLNRLRSFFLSRAFIIAVAIAVPSIATYLFINRRHLRKKSEIVRFKRFY